MEFRDTVVTLLIDNSGSMRAVHHGGGDERRLLARTLERCGSKVEVLGFTNAHVERAVSRASAGSPPASRPTRAASTISATSSTRPADAPWAAGAQEPRPDACARASSRRTSTARPCCWAHNRLVGRGEQRKILMVISDGAPVDDSTLSVNPGNYLERHLREAIGWIENQSPVELIAIGIGHAT